MSDRYRRRGKTLLVIASVMAMMALTSAAASASPSNVPVWKSGGTRLAFGSSSNVSGQSIHGLNIEYETFGGLSIWVTCESLSAVNGKIENPALGKPGALVNISRSTFGPSGTFNGCQLVEYAGKTLSDGLECTIPQQLTMESDAGTLSNSAGPTGGIEIRTYVGPFTVKCPQFKAEWKFTLTGTGRELYAGEKYLEGEEYFSPESTKVSGNFGGTGVASYGLKLADSRGPVTVGEFLYERPTFGTHWYRGGAARSPNEGAGTLIAEGAPTSLSGGAAVSFESVQSGVSMLVSCSGGTVSGSVENPLGGGPGTGSVSLGLTGCAVVKPAGKSCTVVGSSISTKSLPITVKAGLGSEPILQLNPSGGEVGSFTVSGCTIGALNHVDTIKGTLYARPQIYAAKEPGSWLLDGPLNHSLGALTLNEQVATVSGEITAESGGEVVTMD